MANELDHIYIFEDSNDYTRKVIFFKENINPSPEQIDNDFAIIRELAANDAFFLLIDLTVANPPSMAARKALKRNFNSFDNQLMKVFIFTGKNKFMNIAAKFVMSSAGLGDSLIFTLKEEAIKAIPKKKMT
jgi:hypothetical protein